MSDYPPSVQKMVDALLALKAVSEIEVNLEPVDEIDVDSLTLPAEFALLPHLALRRSNGGNENEALVSFKFQLAKDDHGWIAIEFLSWWIRDMCRGEHEIQLRPLAFPPIAGDKIQLGNSLSFILEIFKVEPNDDPMKIAEYVGECGEELMESIELYGNAIEEASPKPKKRFFG
jgi:hypothetical protein